MQVKFQKGYWIILISLMIFPPVDAQERFDSWAGEHQVIISRVKDGHEKRVQLDLRDLSEREWHGEVSHRANMQQTLSLEDGSIIQMMGNDLYLIKNDGEEERLTNDNSTEKNPTLSPNRLKLAYTKDHDLYVFDLKSRKEKRLTMDGSEVIYNGWASWVYYEEILGRSSRYRAFWWSPDGQKIAFLHFDDTPVPVFPIFNSEGQHGSLEMRRYPKAGDPNPDVQFGIADVNSGSIVWVEEEKSKDQYSALPFWTPDSDFILIQELNRSQDTLHLVRINPKDGSRLIIYEETQPTWVDFFEDLEFLNNHEFIIRSNRDGWFNLFKYDLQGNLLTKLTPVDWRVTSIDYIDRENQDIYFYGTGKKNTNRHYFKVGFNGGEMVQLSTGDGWHTVIASPEHQYFVDQYSSLTDPQREKIIGADGNVIYQLKTSEVNPNMQSGVKVEELTIETDDGFKLPGYWVLPKEFNGQKKYPVIFDVYGGPDAGTVRNRFRDYSGDFYSNHDIIRIVVDHRGSGKFGKKGMDYLHRNLGKWEIDDLISAVKWLRTLPFIDSTRIGITGGSYGGYVTAMALTYGADYFTHGISLYPVTDWALYDDVYTERYMDTPVDNPEGYKFGSVLENAHRLKGDLLIVHGMIDDNVHMQNTVQLISRLQDLGKDFELMMYPGERHGWGGAKRTHLSRLINDFWKEHLISPSGTVNTSEP
ncbi:MAG: DPP IV N-terminal domain-containing protein [Saprospiraceae bacterium]|nr:DPP IV N-terminal domain-containing protein [Saprospiraceae bacterium]